MSNIYNTIAALCKEKQVSPSRMCLDIGAAKSLMTELKSGRSKRLSLDTATKIADYFAVPADFLLGRPPFDCWDLIDQNRKGFLYYADVEPMELDLMWGIDPENPDAATIKDFVAFLSDAVEDATPTDEGDWEIKIRPAYRRKKEKAPTLTPKDERDIARDLEHIMDELDAGGDLMFDGDPMTDEARESIRAAMKLGLEAAKVKNKERFTPKRYRKE